MTTNNRQRRFIDRRRAEGWKMLCVWVTPDAAEALRGLPPRRLGEAISAAIVASVMAKPAQPLDSPTP